MEDTGLISRCLSRLPFVQSGGEGGVSRAPPVGPGPHQLQELLEGGSAAIPQQLPGQRDLHQRFGSSLTILSVLSAVLLLMLDV